MSIDLGGDPCLFVERQLEIRDRLGGAVECRLQVRRPGSPQVDEALHIATVRRVLDDQTLVFSGVERLEIDQFLAHGDALLGLFRALNPHR